MSERTIAVIDGNSLLHRAFHALPTTLTGSDGRPTNAVFGFTTMLFSMVDKLSPDAVVAAFDKGKPEFRLEVLEEYKIHRKPTDPELKGQFPMVKRLLEALSVPVVELEGWEGDDILGTLSREAAEQGMRVLLVTGDRDALQLVDDRVSVVTTKRGMSDIVVYDPEGVKERYGVTPGQIPDYLGLKGDTSDNIPGIPGIGEKTAAKLIGEYGSLEDVIEHADELKGKMGENLRSHVQDALDSRQVATIARDVPVECDMRELSWGEWDRSEVVEVFREYRFTSLIDRLLQESAAGTPSDHAPSAPVSLQRVLTGPEALRVARERLEAAEGGTSVAADGGWVGLSVEDGTSCLLPSRRLALAFAEETCVLDEGDAPDLLGLAFGTVRVASGDVKAGLTLVCDDADSDGALDRFDPGTAFDCGIAAYLLESHRGSYDVLTLAAERTGAPEAGEDETQRLGAEAQSAALLAPVLADELAETGSERCYREIEMPLVPVLARMERVGVALDGDALSELSEEMDAEIDRLRAEIVEEAGVEFNIDSPKQLGEILFEQLGLPTGKRTKTGYSTDASVLAPLAASWPIAGKVLEYRELAKLRSTYVEALPRLMDEGDRLHTTFNQTVAATGRLSSSEPNLQNIPVRTALGRRIRAAFVPGRDFDLLMAADYSQIELRILAHLSRDEGLIEAFTSGMDFHRVTASRVFGVDPDDVTTELRNRAKATNFGIVYGISAHGLALQLGIPHGEAQEMIDRYYEAYPGVRRYLDETVERAAKDGYAETMFGRRRYIPELRSRNHARRGFGRRTAMNHPMQGSAADLMKLAMIEVDRRLREGRGEGPSASRLVLQVHDELVLETTSVDADRLETLVRDAMTGVAKLAVPLVVDVSTGKDWAAAK